LVLSKTATKHQIQIHLTGLQFDLFLTLGPGVGAANAFQDGGEGAGAAVVGQEIAAHQPPGVHFMNFHFGRNVLGQLFYPRFLLYTNFT
jgi:hypothetical protein